MCACTLASNLSGYAKWVYFLVLFSSLLVRKNERTKEKEKKKMDWVGKLGNNSVTVDGRVCTGSLCDMISNAHCLRTVRAVLAEIHALTRGRHVSSILCVFGFVLSGRGLLNF